MRRLCSKVCGPRSTIPSCAPRPVPTSSAIGVARPSAHGQAMITTATAAPKAACASAVITSQAIRVTSAKPRTIGTNTAAIRSASRWIGALPVCAAATNRAICANLVCSPTPVARISNRPSRFTVAPTTADPGPTQIGMDSPVNSDSSTELSPSMTSPSVAIRSPGLVMKVSDTSTSARGTSVSIPLRSTVARSRRSDNNSRIAELEVRFARDSNQRPASTNTGSAAATSKYKAGC